MRMIQISYKTLIMAACVAMSPFSPALAQYEEQGVPWPRTFVGEPDFDFLRGEVVDEYKKKKGAESSKYISTLDDLLNAQSIDPFVPRPRTTDMGRSKYSKDVFEQRFVQKKAYQTFREVYPDVEVGTGLEVRMRSGLSIQAKLINDHQAQTLEEENPVTFNIEVTEDGLVVEAVEAESIAETFDKLFKEDDANTEQDQQKNDASGLTGIPSYSLAVNQLPEIENASSEVKGNLTDFALFLDNIIKQTEKSQDADLKDIDFRQYLGGLVLQSVSNSPSKFAIINGRRFTEGDRIPITITYKKKGREDLEKVIDTYMPSEKGMPEDVYKQYQTLKEAALSQYTEKQKEAELEGDLEGQKQTVSGIIKRIESRGIVLSIFDKEYTLEMKFAL